LTSRPNSAQIGFSSVYNTSEFALTSTASRTLIKFV
jgi:hypothetical protein